MKRYHMLIHEGQNETVPKLFENILVQCRGSVKRIGTSYDCTNHGNVVALGLLTQTLVRLCVPNQNIIM